MSDDAALDASECDLELTLLEPSGYAGQGRDTVVKLSQLPLRLSFLNLLLEFPMFCEYS